MAKGLDFFSKNDPFTVLDKGECVNLSADDGGREVMLGKVCRIEKDGEDMIKAHMDMDGEEMNFEFTKSEYEEGDLEI
jgi:hypothetical protein